MSTLRITISLLPCVMLLACKSIYDIGTVPVTLSPKVVAAYEKYRTYEGWPQFFVIDTHGRTFSYSTCPAVHCVRGDGSQQIERCNKRARNWGATCKIFAIDGDIVWEGQVYYPGQSPNEFPFTVSIADPKAHGSLISTGKATIVENNPEIQLKISVGNDQCSGTADKSTGKWSIDCSSVRKYAGTFVEGGRNLYDGIGFLNKEKRVYFAVFNRPELPKGAQVSTGSSTPVKFSTEPANLGAIKLCEEALKDAETGKWSQTEAAQPYVAEATRRGFDIPRCRKFMGDA